MMEHTDGVGRVEVRLWRTVGGEVIDAVQRADPEAAESVRQAFCTVCRLTAQGGQTNARRLLDCTERRCGLRDPERFRAEQEWATVALHLLAEPTRINDQAIADFNRYVAEAGCATVGLARRDDGLPVLAINTATLRARLHTALVGEITAAYGGLEQQEPRPIGEQQAITRGERTSRREWQRQRAAALRAQGISDKQIAQRLKVDPKMIRIWLGKRGEG